MPTRINFYINEKDDELIFNETNNIVYIRIYQTSNNISYEEYCKINYQVNEYLKKKEYYIETNYYDIYTPPNLLTSNFIIKFNNDQDISYYYNYINQIIYFYKNTNTIPFNMLGLKNYNQNLSVLSNFTLINIDNTSDQYLKIISLKNESLKDNNTVELEGSDITISDIILVSSSDITYSYYLYQTTLPLPITQKLKIYFYDPNFIRIINIPYIQLNLKTTDSITLLVELLNSTTVIYSYLININLDFVDTFIKTEYVIFFKNYVSNVTYTSINLRVFDIDYSIYFINLVPGDYILCEQITLPDANLYSILISTNTNIPVSTIPNLDAKDYNKEIDLQYLNNMINFENTQSDLVVKFLDAEQEQFDILVDYLYKYKIKEYNFYNINFSYYYETKPLIPYNQTQNAIKKDIIYPQNVMLNNIIVNIEIFYKDINNVTQSYNIYGIIINNNNTLDIYTKSYSMDEENKYNLLKDITLISLNYIQMNVYIYNNIDDLNNNIKVPILSSSNSTLTNIYYKYNTFYLNTQNSSVGYFLDSNYYLKFYINIKTQYKMLIFYSPFLNSSDYDIINFKLSKETNEICKIFKIKNYSGSVIPGTSAFSMLFQNTKEINEFINYLQTGVYNPFMKDIKSFYNIQRSKNFIKQADGYYVPTDLISGVINFSLINLDLNIGNVYTNNFINYI